MIADCTFRLGRVLFLGLQLGGVMPTSVTNQKLLGIYTVYWVKYM